MTTKEIAYALKLKRDYRLHLQLLQRMGLTLAEARVRAYCQGPEGLEKLLPDEEEKNNG